MTKYKQIDNDHPGTIISENPILPDVYFKDLTGHGTGARGYIRTYLPDVERLKNHAGVGRGVDHVSSAADPQHVARRVPVHRDSDDFRDKTTKRTAAVVQYFVFSQTYIALLEIGMHLYSSSIRSLSIRCR